MNILQKFLSFTGVCTTFVEFYDQYWRIWVDKQAKNWSFYQILTFSMEIMSNVMNLGGRTSRNSSLNLYFLSTGTGCNSVCVSLPPGGYFIKFWLEWDSNANWWISAQTQQIWRNSNDQELTEFQFYVFTYDFRYVV